MKAGFLILLLFFFVLANKAAMQAQPNPLLSVVIKENIIYQPWNTLYVWPADGLNLRQKPPLS